MSATDDDGETVPPRVAFNRLRNEVQAALREGFTRKAIHTKFSDRLGMSYPVFCRYVVGLERTPPSTLVRPVRWKAKPAADTRPPATPDPVPPAGDSAAAPAGEAGTPKPGPVSPPARDTSCLDADSMNGSFSAIPAMRAERVALLDGENELNVEAMNACLSRLLESDGTTVIDSGASSFVPMTVYLHNTGLFDVLLAKGKRIVVHVPIVGGEAMEETVAGLVSMVSQFPASVEFVVWKNAFFGPLVVDDLALEETALFDECRPRIASIVTLHALKPRFEGATFRKMLSQKMTFAEALAPASPFDRISRLWLEGVWSAIKPQIAGAVA